MDGILLLKYSGLHVYLKLTNFCQSNRAPGGELEKDRKTSEKALLCIKIYHNGVNWLVDCVKTLYIGVAARLPPWQRHDQPTTVCPEMNFNGQVPLAPVPLVDLPISSFIEYYQPF